MATWSCTHRRQPEFTYLGLLTDQELERLVVRGLEPERSWARGELAARSLPCPGCRNSNRLYRHHWAALALATIVIGFLLAWGCHG